MESPSSQLCTRHPLTRLPAFTSLSYVSAWTTAVSKTVYSCRSRPDHQPSMPDSRWVCPTSQQLLTVACIILISQVCFLFFIRLTSVLCGLHLNSRLHLQADSRVTSANGNHQLLLPGTTLTTAFAAGLQSFPQCSWPPTASPLPGPECLDVHILCRQARGELTEMHIGCPLTSPHMKNQTRALSAACGCLWPEHTSLTAPIAWSPDDGAR